MEKQLSTEFKVGIGKAPPHLERKQGLRTSPHFSPAASLRAAANVCSFHALYQRPSSPPFLLSHPKLTQYRRPGSSGPSKTLSPVKTSPRSDLVSHPAACLQATITNPAFPYGRTCLADQRTPQKQPPSAGNSSAMSNTRCP